MAYILANFLDQHGEINKQTYERLTGEDEYKRAARKREFSNRAKIYKNDYKDLILNHGARKYFNKPNTVEKIVNYSTTIDNVLQTVVNATAISYARPAVRSLDGAPKRQAQIYHELVVNSDLQSEAQAFEKWATACNLIFVIPQRFEDDLYGPKLRYQIVLPHLADVVLRAGSDDIVDILFYSVGDQSGVDESGRVFEYDTVAIDSIGYYYLKGNRLTRFVDHGLGVCPVIVFRPQRPDPGDFWSIHQNNDLVECTILVSIINAFMRWVRQNNFGKVMHIDLPSMDSAPAKQVKDPSGVLVTTQMGGADAAGSTDITVLDLNVPVTEFIADRDHHVRIAFEHRGLQPQIRSANDGSISVLTEKRRRNELELFRNARLPYLTRAEKELAYKSALVAKYHIGIGIDPAIVLKWFDIEFSELEPVENEQERLANAEKKISLGIWTEIDAYRERYPGVSKTDAEFNVKENILKQAEFNDIRASRQMKKEMEDRTMTLAQEQGQQGGEQKAANAEEDKE